jgi:hypothetical protein
VAFAPQAPPGVPILTAASPAPATATQPAFPPGVKAPAPAVSAQPVDSVVASNTPATQQQQPSTAGTQRPPSEPQTQQPPRIVGSLSDLVTSFENIKQKGGSHSHMGLHSSTDGLVFRKRRPGCRTSIRCTSCLRGGIIVPHSRRTLTSAQI